MAKKYSWVIPTKSELKELIDEDQIEYLTIKVTCEFIEPMLGTVPKNQKIFTDFVSEKMGNYQGKPLKTMEELEEEIESCPDDEKGATGFHKDTFGLFFYNYMILGNIKQNIFILTCNGLGKVLAYKKACDLFINVSPRKVRPYRGDDETLMQPDGSIERPLRAQTAKGERIVLAKSDLIEAKTRFKFEVKLLRNDRGLDMEMLVNAIKMGKENGLGQWRGSGNYGQYRILSLKYI